MVSRLTSAFSAALLFLSVFLPSLSSATPQGQRPPKTSSPNTQAPQVIRTATRLVQVNVVVQDKSGRPITGLKKEDFALLDKLIPAQVRFAYWFVTKVQDR